MGRRPSDWSEAQRAFRSRYAFEREELPRRPVHWRATPPLNSPAASRIAGLVFAAQVLRRAWTRTKLNSSPLVAVWPAESPTGAPALLVFETAQMPSMVEGDGTLVGESETNGTLCLELSDGAVLWPSYNPRAPMTRTAR